MDNISLKTPVAVPSGEYHHGTVEILLLDDIATTLREILRVMKEKP